VLHSTVSSRHARHLISASREAYKPNLVHTSLDGPNPQEFHQRSKKNKDLNRANLN